MVLYSHLLKDFAQFRIWDSSAGIPSPPLALFLAMLPKAHLTLYSKISGSRWVITPSWLSGSWRSFLYSSSVCSCYHLLDTTLSSASVRSIPFLSFILLIFAWNIRLVSVVILQRSLVLPTLSFSSISLHYSLKKASLCLLASLWNFAFRWIYLSFSPLHFASLLFSTICKACLDNHFAPPLFFLAFLFLGDGFDQHLLYNVRNFYPEENQVLPA